MVGWGGYVWWVLLACVKGGGLLGALVGGGEGGEVGVAGWGTLASSKLAATTTTTTTDDGRWRGEVQVLGIYPTNQSPTSEHRNWSTTRYQYELQIVKCNLIEGEPTTLKVVKASTLLQKVPHATSGGMMRSPDQRAQVHALKMPSSATSQRLFKSLCVCSFLALEGSTGSQVKKPFVLFEPLTLVQLENLMSVTRPRPPEHDITAPVHNLDLDNSNLFTVPRKAGQTLHQRSRNRTLSSI